MRRLIRGTLLSRDLRTQKENSFAVHPCIRDAALARAILRAPTAHEHTASQPCSRASRDRSLSRALVGGIMFRVVATITIAIINTTGTSQRMHSSSAFKRTCTQMRSIRKRRVAAALATMPDARAMKCDQARRNAR